MTFDIEREIPPAALVDADQLAVLANMPRGAVREHFNTLGLPPAANYRGKPLWLADDVHKVIG